MYSFKISFSLILTLFYFLMPCLLSSVCFIEACSSRTVPKRRPSTTISLSPSSSSMAVAPARYPATTTTRAPLTTIIPTTTTTTARPNITFPTYKCPATYDAWYCLNEATCFSVKIGDSIMYNCECAIGFMGPRCEYKELDGSYMPKRPRPLLEKASIASGATLAILFILFVCLTIYLRYDQKAKLSMQEEDYYRGNSMSSAGCRYCKQNCCSSDDTKIKEKYDDRNNDDDGGNDAMMKGYWSKSNNKWWLSRVAELGVFGDGVLVDGGDFKKTKPMTYAVKRNAKM